MKKLKPRNSLLRIESKLKKLSKNDSLVIIGGNGRLERLRAKDQLRRRRIEFDRRQKAINICFPFLEEGQISEWNDCVQWQLLVQQNSTIQRLVKRGSQWHP